METESGGRRMFGRDSRLHAWAVAHPLRFGAASGVIIAALFAIAALGSTDGALRTLAGAAAVGVVFAAVFALATMTTL
jgi:hypothetical protein